MQRGAQGRTARAGRRREAGQTLALMALFMTSLLGMTAFAIDLGNWYQVRRELQGSVDAAALAGASQLPVGTSTALSVAQQQYAKNGKATDSVTSTITSDMTSNDSVTVTASRTVNNFFAKVFGISTTTITVSARATVESYTTFAGTGQVMPWGVMRQSFTPGAAYPIYTDGTSANNGAIQPTFKSGGSCVSPSGANDYANEIQGSEIVCPVSVGDVIPVKPGNNSGKTSSGLNTRITGTWETLDQIVQFTGNGQANIIDTNSQQLVMLPVVVNAADGSTNWPNGTSGQIKVVGFAWFVITSCGPANKPSYCKTSDGDEVNGIYVGASIDMPNSTSGAWDPTDSTVYTTALTA
jgi:Flp pilus assembly protein TadG